MSRGYHFRSSDRVKEVSPLFQRESIITANETEKYTDIRVILAQLSGGPAAGTENRRDKVHTLQLEGYRKFDFMLLRLENAATM